MSTTYASLLGKVWRHSSGSIFLHIFHHPPITGFLNNGGSKAKGKFFINWTKPVEPILAQVKLWIIWYGQEVTKSSKKTTIYPGMLVQHVHLLRVTFSEVTAEIFVASITPKNESTQKKKRMAFSSLGETLSLQNHTKSWKGHPATPSPPPDTLPPDLASMVTSLGLLVKSFFFCTCPVFTKQAVDAWHMQLTSFWRLFFQS